MSNQFPINKPFRGFLPAGKVPEVIPPRLEPVVYFRTDKLCVIGGDCFFLN